LPRFRAHYFALYYPRRSSDLGPDYRRRRALEDLRRPAISPFFNLTIRVDNGRSAEPACRPNSVVIVYYGDESTEDQSIAWGQVGAFCVGKRSTVDLDVSLSSKGAVLSPALRDKMALHREGCDSGST